MATKKVTNQNNLIMRALVAQLNALHDATISVTAAGHHNDISSQDVLGNPVALTVSAAAATTLPTSIVMANNLLSVYAIHVADDSAHLIADKVNVSAYKSGKAVDLPTVELVLNDLKAKFNAHLTQAGVHVTNDTTNTVSAAAAVDQASANTLANALATALNAHMASGPAVGKLKILGL